MQRDHGIERLLSATVDAALNGARGSGRTSRMVADLRDGDVVVFGGERHARDVERVALAAGKRIRCVVVHPGDKSMLDAKLAGVRARVWFDHAWIEDYIRAELRRAFSRLAAEMSVREPDPRENAAASAPELTKEALRLQGWLQG